MVAYGDVDLPGVAKAMGLKFSNERERRYDKKTKKRSCTADLAGQFDREAADGAVHVITAGLVYKEDVWLQDVNNHAAFGDDWSKDVVNRRQETPSNASQGSAYDFDQATLDKLHANFVAAVQHYLENVQWHQPQDYTVQLTEKGDTYVALNE